MISVKPGVTFTLLAILVMPPVILADGVAPKSTVVSVDVFATLTQRALTGNFYDLDVHEYRVAIHSIDGIERFEEQIGKSLPGDRQQAKSLVLARLKNVSVVQTENLEQSAKSLALAAVYGVERYPAVVFDGQWVVYGVIDLANAIRIYEKWQESGSQ